MMKSFLIILLIFSVTIFAQQKEDKNPNVELPEFVITGTDIINIESSDKIDPEFVSTISDEFIKPAYSPEQLETREVTNPMERDINLFEPLNYLNGELNAGAGIYSLPKTNIKLIHKFSNGMIKGFASGYNQRSYIDNSDMYSLNGGIDFSYFVNTEAGFFPGTSINFNGDYGLSSYKLFASLNPEFKRNLQTGNLNLSVGNSLSDKYLLYISAGDEYTSLSDENLSEHLFNAAGYANYNFGNFNIGFNLNYKGQSINNDSIPFVDNNFYNYIYMRPAIGLDIGNTIKVKFGISYSKALGTTYLVPYGSMGLKLDKSIYMYAEYKPQLHFYGIGFYLRENKFLNNETVVNTLVKKTSDLKIVIKYEYEQYFQIDGGVKYFSSPSLPFYTSINNSGEFDINYADAKGIGGFINFLFYTGPYGSFFGSATFQNVSDTSKNIVPYNPGIKTELAYRYFFNRINVGTEINAEYYSKVYDDINNTRELNSIFDIGLKFNYRFNPNFYITLELNNLIDHNNYKWYGYKQKPLDVIAGFKYTW